MKLYKQQKRKATRKSIEATLNLYKYYYEQFKPSTKKNTVETIDTSSSEG